MTRGPNLPRRPTQDHEHESRYAVIVVGCGPVGMTLANLLGSNDIPTLVLEQNETLYDFPRAVGADADCLRAWQAIGLDRNLVPAMIPSGPDGMGMVYLDDRERAFLEVRPARRDYGFATGYGFIQPLVDRALLDGLARFTGVEVRFGCRVERVTQDERGVQARGTDSAGRPFIARARYLVACDGGKSPVRRSLGLRMEGSRFRQRWLVLDTIEPETIDRDVRNVKIWCDSRRPAVCIPRRFGHRRWEFLARPEESDEYLLDPGTIHTLLQRHIDPNRIDVRRSLVYTFHARIASRFRDGRVLLAGDAAHVTPPFAGQGLAIGIRDAFNLAWKLAAVARGSADATLLDTYEQERRAHAWASITLAVRLGRLMTPRGRMRAALVPAAVRLLTRNRHLRAYLREGGPKPRSRLRAGFLVAPTRRRSVAGWQARQPMVASPSGTRTPLDTALGGAFACLGFGCHPARVLDVHTRARWTGLGTRFIEVVPAGGRGGEDTWIEDVEGALAAWLGKVAGRVLVIRPDRYVAADCRPNELEHVLATLHTYLVGARGSPAL